MSQSQFSGYYDRLKHDWSDDTTPGIPHTQSLSISRISKGMRWELRRSRNEGTVAKATAITMEAMIGPHRGTDSNDNIGRRDDHGK